MHVPLYMLLLCMFPAKINLLHTEDYLLSQSSNEVIFICLQKDN